MRVGRVSRFLRGVRTTKKIVFRKEKNKQNNWTGRERVIHQLLNIVLAIITGPKPSMEGDGWSRVAFAGASLPVRRGRAEHGALASHPSMRCQAFVRPRSPHPLGANGHPSLCSSILYQRRWAQRDCARVLWIRADHWYSQTGTKSSLNPAQGSSCTKPPKKKNPD